MDGASVAQLTKQAASAFTVGLTVVNGIFTVVSLLGALQAYRERKRSAYVWFYDIIARHHSEEMTALRGEVLSDLGREAAAAREQGSTLRDIHPAFYAKVMTLVNYYEGVGMFLRGAWRLFPAESQDVMCRMFHHSVGKTWHLLNEYADEIRPDRQADWAAGLRWLYEETADMRVKVAKDRPAV